MDALPHEPMTADAFLAWSLEQTEGRYELLNGLVVRNQAERALHARVKGLVFRALGDAIATAQLGCEAFIDGMAVRVDRENVFEPDAAVRCGPALGDAAVEYSDPVIVVEVTSPSTRRYDLSYKLEQYLSLPSLEHYLILVASTRRVIHHARVPGGFLTHILAAGPLVLDPPGLTLDVAALFPPEAV